tara:strand:- start:94 stop:1794 length:1701 start_codon:yes stop_codon:yes gene_type:complete
MPRTDSSYFNFILRNNSARFNDKISVLDEDDYDAYSYESFNSDDITYDSGAGTVSFGKGGAYEVTFSEILTNAGAGNQNTSPKFFVNNTLKYVSQVWRAVSSDPQCHIHRAILEIPDNGTLKIMLDVSGAQDSYLHAGSIVVANRLTGRYGRVHLSASTRPFTNINPFTASHLVLTDGTGRATISDGKLLSGVGYDDTHGRLISSGTSFHRSTAPGGSGIYAVAFNGLFGTGSVGGMSITASQNGVDFYNMACFNPNTVDPIPHNFHVLRTMKSDDYISLYAQCYGTDHTLGAGTNAMTEGTTFAIYEIPNFAYYSATIQSEPTEADEYGPVNNGDSEGIAGDTPKNVWDLDDSEVWTGIRSASVTVHAESPYVNYNPTNGRFTVKRGGVYYLSAITKIRSSALATGRLTKRLYVNGAVHISGTEEFVYGGTGAPRNYNHAIGDIITLLTLSANDYIEVTHESTNAFKYGNGSCMTMYQVGSDWKYKDDDYTFNQGRASEDLIGDNFIINTYSTGSKNIQHKRDVLQTPFIASTPGPLSLRGKVEVDKLSKILNEADAERYLFTKK